jgi:DNA repair protein NreA
MEYCRICNEDNCKHSFFLGRRREIESFSGSSPPEVFVGRRGYPNVYVGILSPEEYGNTKIMSSAKEWKAKSLIIPEILGMRNSLIYGRTKGNIKKVLKGGQFMSVMQEIAMTHKSVATEVKLKKRIVKHDERESRVPLISNAGEVKRVRLEENPKIKRKVDYLVNDTDVKSVNAMLELEKAGVENYDMIKLLSSGLLGLRKSRKLVPTRWAITATDDALSKDKIGRIRYYPEIQEFRVFSEEYLGNHYEFLLIPRYWSFEVIEISMKNFGVWSDFESIFRRKKYADSVTGVYYANRLALTEYLDKIKRQAACIVFREIRPEYYVPLGVGILRETSRAAFKNVGKKFDNLASALEDIQSRLRIPVKQYLEEGQLMREMQQRTLSHFF